MKLIGYTCTYNEAEMVPYVMPYVETLGYWDGLKNYKI